MQKITDVFFDLDHTLWDFDKNSKLAFKRVFKTHNVGLGIEEFISIYEPINEHYWKAYREDRVTKEQLRRGRLVDTFKSFNLSFSEKKIDQLADSYIEELPEDNHLFSGAITLLNYLKPNYSLHIITNGFNEVQQKKISKSGIKSYFNTITTSEEVGLKKPHPVIFETALKKAKAQPEKSIMIGDSLEADIQGAQAVGMETLFFNYRNQVVSSNQKTVKQLLQIKNYL